MDPVLALLAAIVVAVLALAGLKASPAAPPSTTAPAGPRPGPTRARKAATGATIGGVVITAALAAYQADFTGSWEGVRFIPYKPVPSDPWTVCIGHTGPDIVLGKTYTKAECQALFDADMALVDQGLGSCVNPPAPLDPSVVIALRDFAFNVGTARACSSTLVKRLNAGDTAGACSEFQKWVLAGGVKYPGLVARRLTGGGGRRSETDLCRNGL